MSFFTTEPLPVLDGMFYNRLGGAARWKESSSGRNKEIVSERYNIATIANDFLKAGLLLASTRLRLVLFQYPYNSRIIPLCYFMSIIPEKMLSATLFRSASSLLIDFNFLSLLTPPLPTVLTL